MSYEYNLVSGIEKATLVQENLKAFLKLFLGKKWRIRNFVKLTFDVCSQFAKVEVKET